MKTPLMHTVSRVLLVLVILLLFPTVYLGKHYFQQQQAPQAPEIIPADQASIEITGNTLDIAHWITPEGTKVVFVPLHELPIIDIDIVFAAGSAYDGAKFGNAQLTAQLIGEDAGDMNSDALHEAFESVGAIFNANIDLDTLSISLRTLSDPPLRDAALNTFETILGKTTFTIPAFEREKNKLLTQILSQKQNPQATISDAFFAGIYGTHPYAHPSEGTSETVTALTLADVQQFHANYLVKNNAVIAITGDLSLEAAHELSNKLIQALPAGQAAAPIPAVEVLNGQQTTVAFPSSQTHLMMGLPTIAKGDPDFFALSVGNQILGVTPLVNRLFDAVREKNGLAYNVGSSLSTLKQAGPFMIYLQSRAQEADKALALVNETLTSYLQTGPTEAELQAAKDNLTGQFVLALSNNAAINAHLATLAFYNLPWDYAQRYQENIQAVTLEQVKDVFTRYIKPNEFTMIRLGDKT